MLPSLPLVALMALLPAAHGSDGFVKLDFDIFKGLDLPLAISDFLLGIHARDSGATNVNITNEKAFYVAKLAVGTPSSELSVLLDTGLADLWVQLAKNPQCQSNGGSVDCSQYGAFDETNLSTWKKNNTAFSITYLDNSNANGTFGQDTVGLTSSLSVEGANFAVAENLNTNVGVFGIGFQQLESSSSLYSNLPIQLKEQGYIHKVAYSLYLTSQEATTGAILFGGVDQAKYTGELVELDITKSNGAYTYLQIPLSSIRVDLTSSPSPAPSLTSPFPGLPHPTIAKRASNSTATEAASTGTVDMKNTDALLDSGTTLTILPQDNVDLIIKLVAPGASYSQLAGAYTVPCSLKASGNSLVFDFDGKKDIRVPLSDLVRDAGTDQKTGEDICTLGVVPGLMVILGDNFLRSCYTVFNLDDRTVSIAQMKYTDDEDIQVIS